VNLSLTSYVFVILGAMKRVRIIQSGYTIVEVLIVLAVTGIIFIASNSLFGGQKSEAAFNQAVNDVVSEIATQGKAVGSNQFYAAQGYSCTGAPTTARATLTAAAGSSGVNTECLSLGKVFEALSTTTNIYIYDVLGNRQYYASGTLIGPASSLTESSPTIASIAGKELALQYQLGGGMKIVSSKVTTASASGVAAGLVGYYLDFTGSSANSQSSANLTAKAYNLVTTTHDSAVAKSCVEGNGCTSPTDISLWTLCLVSSGGNKNAMINTSNSSAGITVTSKYTSCS
jgi:prepilin-type N-terminal cleavage/methylation domain-containing protein